MKNPIVVDERKCPHGTQGMGEPILDALEKVVEDLTLTAR